jgi:hypothetical protein
MKLSGSYFQKCRGDELLSGCFGDHRYFTGEKKNLFVSVRMGMASPGAPWIDAEGMAIGDGSGAFQTLKRVYHKTPVIPVIVEIKTAHQR